MIIYLGGGFSLLKNYKEEKRIRAKFKKWHRLFSFSFIEQFPSVRKTFISYRRRKRK